MASPRRPVRNIAARSWCAEVRRFLRLINTDEVFGTHTPNSDHSTAEFVYLVSVKRRHRTTALICRLLPSGIESHSGAAEDAQMFETSSAGLNMRFLVAASWRPLASLCRPRSYTLRS